MDKQLNKNEMDALARADKGGSHRSWKWGGRKIGRYNLAGRLEEVYEDIDSAVEANREIGATYQGIHACVSGKQKKHAGKIWRAEKEDD